MKNIKNFVSGFTEEMSSLLKDKYIEIPIYPNMLLFLLKKGDLPGLSNIEVGIETENIIISGIAKKLLINIKFSIELKPLMPNGRELSFNITNMKPINHDWIKRKIFDNTRGISYHENIVTIDFNQIDKIRAVSIGSIKKIEIKDNSLLVSLGL
jgi:hypothetical protein